MPYCIIRQNGEKLVFRICAASKPFPANPGEQVYEVNSCDECPTYPSGDDTNDLVQDIKQAVIEAIRETKHD